MEKGKKEREKKEGRERRGSKEKGKKEKKLKTQGEQKAADILDVIVIYMRHYHGNTRIT